jgi:hypothetical protein
MFLLIPWSEHYTVMENTSELEQREEGIRQFLVMYGTPEPEAVEQAADSAFSAALRDIANALDLPPPDEPSPCA